MNPASFIASRLSLADTNGRRSPAVAVAVAAVALSIAVMIAAISIVVGFKEEISSRVRNFNSHITLFPEQSADDGYSPILTLSPSLKETLSRNNLLNDFSLQATAPAVLKTPTDFKGLYLRSLSGNNLLDFLNSSVTSGIIPDFSNPANDSFIVLGQNCASSLGLEVGDSVPVYFITDGIRVRSMKIAAVFNSHFESYDNSYAFCSLPLLQQIASLSPNQATSIVGSVDDFNDVEIIASQLQSDLIGAYTSGYLPRLYRVQSALDSGANYYSWLRLLDTNVWVILTLMTLVAAITLIGGLLILMADKIHVVALFSALGASRSLISRIFIFLTSKIALIGMLLGNILGLSFVLIQHFTHILPLDPETYYMDFVPTALCWPLFIILDLAVLAILALLLIIPASMAARKSPAHMLSSD